MFLALRRPVATTLVLDRYVRVAERRWLDLATGVVAAAIDADGVASAMEPEAEQSARLTDRIMGAAEAVEGAGIRVMSMTTGGLAVTRLLDAVADRVRRAGFVAVRAAVDLPLTVRQELVHRHLVLLASQEECASPHGGFVLRWIRDVTTASPRAHVLVVLRGHPPSHPVSADVASWGAPLVRDRAWFDPDRPEMDASWSQYRANMAQAAASYIADACLDRADAAMRGVAAEAALRHEELPQILVLLRAELAFWRGRFDEAVRWLDQARSDGPSHERWRRLVHWGAGKAAAIDPDGLDAPARPYLTRAVAAQARLSAGDVRGALQVIAAVRRDRSPRRPLEQALLRRIEVGCLEALGGDAASDRRDIDAFVRATGTRGLLRWGLGRAAMNLLHGLSSLLEVIEDADDECTALRRGCAWVREQGSAHAAGIVTGDGTRVIAGEGFAAADLHDSEVQAVVAGRRSRVVAGGAQATVAVPVRHAGSTIGFVVARGRLDAAESVTSAAKALAAVCAGSVRARLDHLALAAAGRTQVPEILGRSPAMTGLREAIARAAGTTFPVLIEGESGTGKELVARAVHRLSARRDRRFAALNCAALSDDLIEAELFGHARGAFTGALADRAGLFEESHGSTLFLDEVAELSPRAQAKLLRVLQEREIRRVGEHVPRRVDVRVVAATNLPLAQAVGTGRFREDLLFRLAVVRIKVPPLRERIEDVPLLAQAFWRAFSAETGKQAQLGADATAALCRHRWPGNVRELQNVVAGLALVAPSRGRVGARHVGQALAGGSAESSSIDVTLARARHALERRMIASALARHAGRCSRAARELGLSRQGLAKAMKRLGVATPVEQDRTGS